MQGKVPIVGAAVSVCHQLSQIGTLPLPMCSLAHSRASGLSGSPAQTIMRKLSRLCAAGCCGPNFMNMRKVVGAVKIFVTWYFSTMSQTMPGCGKSGAPSRAITVVPLDHGPYTMEGGPTIQPMSDMHQ